MTTEDHDHGEFGDDPMYDDPAYIAYCEERDAEHERELAHGGRSKCPNCNEYGQEHRVVNHADPTDLATCKFCGAVEIFGDLFIDGRFVRSLVSS